MENLGYKEGWSRRSVRVRNTPNTEATTATVTAPTTPINEEAPLSNRQR